MLVVTLPRIRAVVPALDQSRAEKLSFQHSRTEGRPVARPHRPEVHASCMSVNLLGLISSPERRHAQQLAYSVEMVGDIASSYDGALDRHEYAFARCMLDAFYVHVRLLADFLVTRTDRKDFGPADSESNGWRQTLPGQRD
jgi:hypothetical protein